MAIAPESVPEEFVSETVVFDYKTPAKEAFEKIKRFGTVIVTKSGEYYGVVDNRAIARKGSLKINDKYPIGKFATKAPAVDKTVSVDKAISQFSEFAVKALPYMTGNVPKGIVKREEVLKAILSLHRLSGYAVQDAMSSPIIAIDANAPISQAKTAMQNRKVNRLVVLDDGRLVGMLTYANIIEQSANLEQRVGRQNRNRSTVSYRVMDLCEKSIRKIEPKAPLEDAIRDLLKYEISSLLVSRGEQPVGMITTRDIFRAASAIAPLSEENIVISGLDKEMTEYEDDIRSSLQDLVDRINKFRMLQVDKILLTVKRVKVRNYEAKGRITFVKGGAIEASSSDFSLEKTIDSLTDKLYGEAKEIKERRSAKTKAKEVSYE